MRTLRIIACANLVLCAAMVSAQVTQEVTAIQYFYDSDPGEGVTGNGAILPITPTDDLTQTLSIALTGSLPVGFHRLYVRFEDENGRWSIVEGRTFYISETHEASDITVYQYFFDTDPSVGEPGNGAVEPITPMADFNQEVTIPVPGSLSGGFHQLFIRALDASGHWSIVDKRMFYIHATPPVTTELVALEYYYDIDPGEGNANPYPIPSTGDFDETANIGVPCLSTGTHYFYLRAQDTYGRWSIIARDTVEITNGVAASDIAPAGPVDICPGNEQELSTDPVDGVSYQWVLNGDPIPGATDASYTVTTAGDYALQAICGSDFVISNTVTVTLLPLYTYYTDADGDGYGDPGNTAVDCSQPSGYVTNGDDCDDTNDQIHPGAVELCNLIDDNCNGQIDEGVQTTFYADSDGDGFGNAGMTVLACTAPSGYVPDNSDCDDSNADVHPGATELCNGIDDNCDGQIDEGVQSTFYADNDGDGFGDPSVTVLACTVPSGYVTDNSDCDDSNADVHPGATELCNSIDDNCDGTIDEGYTYSVAAATVVSSEGLEFCFGPSTQLSITGGSLGTDAQWYWYEGDCGSGGAIGSGESVSVTPSAGSHTYYVRAEGTCNATDCISISIMVDSAPVYTSCAADILTSTQPSVCNAAVSYSVSTDGAPAPTYSYVFTGDTEGSGDGTGSGSTFNQGTTTVTVTATNACGTAQCQFNITIEDDEAPVITDCPDEIEAEVEPGQWGAHVTWSAPAAMDNCTLNSLTGDHLSGDFFNVGSTIVTYTATDDAGNSSECQFDVTVTPPNLVGKVNVAISTYDITFSNNNPEPGTAINVSTKIHNTSSLEAGSFVVRLVEMYSNTTYASVTIPGLSPTGSTTVNWVVNTPGNAAFVPIQVTIDVLNDLDEGNELDNVAVKPFICGTPESLATLGAITAPVPDSVTAGSTIQLCGSAYYENTDPPLDDPSVAGAAITITIAETGSLISGYTNENGDFCIGYKTPNTPGVYHYTVEVSDNTLGGDASGTFTLTPPPPPPCNLDLSVNLSGIPTKVVVGTTFSGTVNVRNGCQEITQPTTLFVAMPNATPASGLYSIPALAPYQTYDVVVPTMTFTTTGTSYVSATVDYYNVVAEDNEYNNTAFRITWILPALPDLVPTGYKFLSDQHCGGEANQAYIEIHNIGGVESGSFNAVLEFYGDGTLQSTQTENIANLYPDDPSTGIGGTSLIFPFPLAVEVDSFVLMIDTPNVVTELSELNNNISFPYAFQSLCKPDLEMRECQFTDVKPADPVPGENITATVAIRNHGQLDITEPFSVDFDFGGNVVPVLVTDPLAVNQTIFLSATAPAPTEPGSQLIVTADPANAIDELLENNNSYSTLLCQEFAFETGVFDNMQSFCDPGVFRIGVTNNGVYEASNVEVLFEISGPGLSGWVNLGTTSMYMNNTCTGPSYAELSNTFYFPQTGIYNVRMTLDPGDMYAECDESNNEVTLIINVEENLVDYEVLSGDIVPTDLNPDINEPVSFNISYRNVGCDGFSPLELYAGVDEVPLDSVIVGALGEYESSTVVMPTSWSSSVPGVHIVRAIIDHDEQFSEADELNNEATRAIIVGEAPDYNVLSIEASDTTPVYGELLTLTAAIHNDGQSTGSGTLQYLYDDLQNGETLIDQHTISVLPGETLTESIPWLAVAPDGKVIARVINVSPVEFDFSDNEKSQQLNDLFVDITSTQVECSGFDLGTMEVEISGGHPPYVINWSNGLTDPIISVPAGIYSVQVTDIDGRSVNKEDTIVNLALPITWYEDADGDGFGNPDSYVVICDQPEGYVGNGNDCDDIHANVNPAAPEIQDGLDNDCDGQVDEGFSMLSVDAGGCASVYLGYAPTECTELTADVSEGTPPYTFVWSNGATDSSTTVCPEETSIYSVTVSDANGFTAQDVVTVQVVDIRCGNNNNKVLICHIPPGNPDNPQNICVAESAVQAHLDHGDYLGVCDAVDPCLDQEGETFSESPQGSTVRAMERGKTESADAPGTMKQPLTCILYPNPSSGDVTVKLSDFNRNYEVWVNDISGKVCLHDHFDGGIYQLQTGLLDNGIYAVRIQTADQMLTKVLAILH